MLDSFFLHASPLLQLMTLFFTLSTIAYIISVFQRNALLNKICLGLFGVGTLFNVAHFVVRWMEAGRAPIKSRFEAMLLLALTIAILSIAVELMHKVRLMGLFSSISILVTIFLAFCGLPVLIVDHINVLTILDRISDFLHAHVGLHEVCFCQLDQVVVNML